MAEGGSRGRSTTAASPVAAAKPVFSIGTLAMAVTMVAAILGASVDTGVAAADRPRDVAYGAIACNLAAVKIEIDALSESEPRRRRGQSPARRVTAPILELSAVTQGLSRPAAAADRAARRSRPASSWRIARPRSASRRSVRQPRDRRDAARSRVKSSMFGRPTSAIARQRRLARDRRSLRHRQRARGAARRADGDSESGDAVLARDRAAARRRAGAGARAGARGGTAEADSWDASGGGARRRRRGCASGWVRALALDPAVLLLRASDAPALDAATTWRASAATFARC